MVSTIPIAIESSKIWQVHVVTSHFQGLHNKCKSLVEVPVSIMTFCPACLAQVKQSLSFGPMILHMLRHNLL